MQEKRFEEPWLQEGVTVFSKPIRGKVCPYQKHIFFCPKVDCPDCPAFPGGEEVYKEVDNGESK